MSYQRTASARSARAACVNSSRATYRDRRSSSASMSSQGTASRRSASKVASRRSSSASCAGVNRTSAAERLSQSSPMRSSRSFGVRRLMSSVAIVPNPFGPFANEITILKGPSRPISLSSRPMGRRRQPGTDRFLAIGSATLLRIRPFRAASGDRPLTLGLRLEGHPKRKMVPRKGLEPSRPLSHWHLKPARLPIPPPGHAVWGTEAVTTVR